MKDPATFARITAALFLALSILLLLIDGLGLLMFHFFLRDFFQNMDYANSMGPVSAWRIAHMELQYCVHIPISLTALAGCVGILYKKPWGPTTFFYFLSAIIPYHLLNLGISVAVLFTLPDMDSAGAMPHLPRPMMILSAGFGALWIVALIIPYSWLWFSFRKREVQTLFG